VNDIDFDELDRAVSTAIGSPSDTPSAPPKTSSDAPSPSTPEASPETPSLPVPERTASTSDRPVQAPAARRSSGRFMDVVHPSSDMRGTTGSSNTPSAPSTASSPSDTTPEKPEQTWPDPIDLAEQSQKSTESEPSDSAETPFLNGAKVEKRPLGGPAPTSSLDDALAQLNMSGDTTSGDQASSEVSESEPKTFETPLNPEPSIPEPPHEDAEAEALGNLENSIAQEPSSETVADAEPQSTPTEHPSIPQQYTERAPAHDAEQSGAIFDTESYHQPLAHPEKKNSGLLVVLWILGLIVLGGGLGAAAYFFVLPLL